MAIWSRLNAFLIGGAVARAGTDAVTPVLEPVRQHAWMKNQLRVLDPNSAARLVAQGAAKLASAEDEAARSGYGADRLAALVYLAQTAPGVAEALTLYRREKIDLPTLEHAYAKASIDKRYWAGLTATANVLLTPAEIANAIQQGHLANEQVLPSPGPPTVYPPGYKQPPAPDAQPPTDVPLTQIPIDGVKQAAHQGTDFEQLQVLANLAGLPPGPEALLTMWNRSLISEAAVDAGIREGHMKTKWMQAFKRMRWAVLSPQDAASARLRTWIDAEKSYEIGALHGLDKEQMDLLFLNRGRPASPTQMWTAWARKVVGPRNVPVEYEDHAKAIAISDIRPEYAEMLWGIRFAYPSLFQLNRLVLAGTVDADTAATWAEYNRYAPEVVAALRKAWAQPAAATKPDPHVALAERQVIAAAKKAVLAGEKTEADVTPTLTRYVTDPAALTAILEAWTAEREVMVKPLTPSQIRKAYRDNLYTIEAATTRLEQVGYTPADAATFLGE